MPIKALEKKKWKKKNNHLNLLLLSKAWLEKSLTARCSNWCFVKPKSNAMLRKSSMVADWRKLAVVSRAWSKLFICEDVKNIF